MFTVQTKQNSLFYFLKLSLVSADFLECGTSVKSPGKVQLCPAVVFSLENKQDLYYLSGYSYITEKGAVVFQLQEGVDQFQPF